MNRCLLYHWKSDHLAKLDESSGAKAGPKSTEIPAEIEQIRKRLAKAFQSRLSIGNSLNRRSWTRSHQFESGSTG